MSSLHSEVKIGNLVSLHLPLCFRASVAQLPLPLSPLLSSGTRFSQPRKINKLPSRNLQGPEKRQTRRPRLIIGPSCLHACTKSRMSAKRRGNCSSFCAHFSINKINSQILKINSQNLKINSQNREQTVRNSARKHITVGKKVRSIFLETQNVGQIN